MRESQLPIKIIVLPLIYLIPIHSFPYMSSWKIGSRPLVIPYCNKLLALELSIVIPAAWLIKSGIRGIAPRTDLIDWTQLPIEKIGVLNFSILTIYIYII